MAIVRIQGENEKVLGIYYEYNPSAPPLGQGGMGKVYKGWLCNEMNNHRREVAIKFLYSDLPPHVIARARREASVQLRNDNLIEMLGFVETTSKDEIGQSAVHYHVVSEYLHGVTLDKLMEGKVTDHTGNVIPFAQELYGKLMNDRYSFALTVIRSLLSGLMALHDAGYIHRDIDPSNIMVTSSGKIKLIDFGISKRINGVNTEESSYTVKGQFIGKPKYAAPEQVRGLNDSLNRTTDLYAVGILLYELLIGHVPFEGEMAEVLQMQLTRKMPLADVRQKQMREVIRKATQKIRGKRFQSAAEFRVAVDRLVPLKYPDTGFNVKYIGMGIGGAAAVAAIIVGAMMMFGGKDDGSDNNQDQMALRHLLTQNELLKERLDTELLKERLDTLKEPLETKEPMPTETYDKAVALLSSPATAQEGLNMLGNLVDKKDYRATFLMSRLLFKSDDDVPVDNFADTIAAYRKNADIKTPRNKEAHELLRQAVGINPNDYRSLYERGCDYKSDNRGAFINKDSARKYLNQALDCARAAGNIRYVKALNDRLENIKR